jgi:hypothetical protein
MKICRSIVKRLRNKPIEEWKRDRLNSGTAVIDGTNQGQSSRTRKVYLAGSAGSIHCGFMLP